MPKLARVSLLLLCLGCSATSASSLGPPPPPASSESPAAASSSSPELPSGGGAGGLPIVGPILRALPQRPGPAEMAERQWENASAIDGAQCRSMLKAAGFRFTPLHDVATRDKHGCGIPHGVVVSRGPTGVVYDPPLVIDCSLALALSDVEAVVQDEAAKELDTSISRIGDLGSYACRRRRSPIWGDAMSEHSFGTAVDLSSFQPKNGRAIVVARDYDLAVADESLLATRPRARFLRAVYARLRAMRGDGKLSIVLGPEFNAEHRDHFHLDRGYRWWMGT